MWLLPALRALRHTAGNALRPARELALLWDKSQLKQRLNHKPLPILPCSVFLWFGGGLFVGFFVYLTQSIVLAPQGLRWRSTQWMNQWVFKVLQTICFFSLSCALTQTIVLHYLSSPSCTLFSACRLLQLFSPYLKK